MLAAPSCWGTSCGRSLDDDKRQLYRGSVSHARRRIAEAGEHFLLERMQTVRIAGGVFCRRHKLGWSGKCDRDHNRNKNLNEALQKKLGEATKLIAVVRSEHEPSLP